MNKTLLTGLALCTMLLVSSCGSKESAYRKAYEQAKQREIAAQDNSSYNNTTTPEVAQPVSKPAATEVSVRKENLSVMPGENSENLKQFSVVIGSFSNPQNAYNLKNKMVALGYKAVLAKNDMGMLRVIVASFPTRSEAAASRDAIKAHFAPQFSDAWLLEKTN